MKHGATVQSSKEQHQVHHEGLFDELHLEKDLNKMDEQNEGFEQALSHSS